MTPAIIDACSLINLYAGWGSLRNLEALGSPWYLGEKVATEAHYTLTEEADGGLIRIKIDIARELSNYLLMCNVESDAELSLYVDLAQEMDDGEAQSLALAKLRNWSLATDDRKATAVAGKLGVPILDTPTILQQWAAITKCSDRELCETLKRVTQRARFTPPKSSSLHEWWISRMSWYRS